MFATARRVFRTILDYPIELIVKHFENRLFELAMSSIFLVESIFLALSPGSIEAGGMKYLTLMVNLPTAILLFFIIGAGRILALALNGHWVPYGAYVRAVGAALGVVMWLQVAAALVVFATMGNAIPFSTPVYVVLAVYEGVSMFRALAGARRDGSIGNRAVEVGDLQDRIFSAYTAGKHHSGGDSSADHRRAR